MSTPANPITAHAVLQHIISTRFPTPDQNKAVEAIQHWAQEVVFQESSIDNAIQKSRITGKKDGPGRGYFQYEMKAHGGSGSNQTAVTRAIGLFKLPQQKSLTVPAWLTALSGVDVDFTTLSAEQQFLIFYIDKNQHPNVVFKALIDAYGTDKWKAVSEENWKKGHHGGTEAHQWRGSDAPPYNSPQWNELSPAGKLLG